MHRMNYHISYTNPHSHFVDIELRIENHSGQELFLHLPAWRPGRYELAHYAKNIQRFEVSTSEGKALPHQKVSKDRWKVETGSSSAIVVKYNYYAYQMDAGASYLDEHQLYLNFINCLVYAEGRMEEPCRLTLQLPETYRIACGLTQVEHHTLEARDYYQLVDSPMIASATLQHGAYQVQGSTFHIWVQDVAGIDTHKWIEPFRAFTKAQIEMFGSFPEPDYHFLFQILPYRHYHGVEHQNSTVITLGPDYKIETQAMVKDLMGISSHELFHTWNVIRIRPAEMLPYNFTGENYFRTGFVAEGLTTYYGDLFLARAGVLSREQYFEEIHKLLKRHFDNPGRLNMSVADSSYDLWLDGYVPGIPGRKVSIYNEGAIAALLLDLELRRSSQNKRSLDDVMRLLWQRHGKDMIGYTFDDYRNIVEEVAGADMTHYFEECIEGRIDLLAKLEEALAYMGISLARQESLSPLESLLGCRCILKDGKILVDTMAPGSPAVAMLSKGDELVALGGRRVEANADELFAFYLATTPAETLTIHIFRDNQLREILLPLGAQLYYPYYQLVSWADEGSGQLYSQQLWLGQ
jgi:predicted metalloprotease with PDZ domain